MVDDEEFSRWRRAADEALAGARVLAAAEHAASACFQAEQAAQHAVKAFLHGVGVGLRGHDLVVLAARLQAQGVDLPAEAREALARLSRHYIAARYPDAYVEGTPGEHYTSADAAQALADADAVLRLVDAAWMLVS